MHEISVCQSILAILEKRLEHNSEKKVKIIHLAIGELSGIELDALRFAFPIVMQHTRFETATLKITVIPALGFCENCNKSVKISSAFRCCSDCKKPISKLIQGDELLIKEVEL